MTEHTAASKRTPVNKPTGHRTIIYNSNPKKNQENKFSIQTVNWTKTEESVLYVDLCR